MKLPGWPISKGGGICDSRFLETGETGDGMFPSNFELLLALSQLRFRCKIVPVRNNSVVLLQQQDALCLRRLSQIAIQGPQRESIAVGEFQVCRVVDREAMLLT